MAEPKGDEEDGRAEVRAAEVCAADGVDGAAIK
jgi:hypothetical protein